MEVTIDGVVYAPVVKVDSVKLSILVPAVSTRRNSLSKPVLDALFNQHDALSEDDRKRVEILVLTDVPYSRGGMMIGDKRNAMVRMARGEYVVFVDDDDRVTADYVQSLLFATAFNPDCITFDAAVSVNGAKPMRCIYSRRFEADRNTASEYERLPNHITAVRRDLALMCPFASMQKGEDSDYAKRLRLLLKTEYRIDKVLYHYDFNSASTETQQTFATGGHVPAPPPHVIGGQMPTAAYPDDTVDLIMMSKASTPALRAMTQNAIDSARSGAGALNANLRIRVIEQCMDIKYSNAETSYDPSPFHYNKFANEGARCGTAKWIMIANNDLEFEAGWLHALLAVQADCLSPVDPGNKRQHGVRGHAAGFENGLHFSGWCFMMKRTLYDKIGGFDECVSYWCSDDVVIEQCRKASIAPVVVAASRVLHRVSATASKPVDDMTWGQVAIFNKHYPETKRFMNDARYLNYCKRMGVQP